MYPILFSNILYVTVGVSIFFLVTSMSTYASSNCLYTVITTVVPSGPFTSAATSAVSISKQLSPFTAKMISSFLKPASSAGVPTMILLKTG